MVYRDMVPILVAVLIGAPWLGAILVTVVSANRPRIQHGVATIAGLFSALAAVLLLSQRMWLSTDEIAFGIPFGPFIGEMSFVTDSLAVYLSAIAAIVGTLTIIFSIGYMSGSPQLGRYYALVLLFIGSMCGLVLSGNLLFLFLFWEATAFCSYALISFHNDDPKAVAAGIKALIVTQVGGAGLLIGIVIAAANLPDLQVTTLLAQAGTIPTTTLAIIGFGFLLAAIAKSAQVPLHIWLPDAMEAPTPVSALIHAATMVNAGVYLLARFYPAFAPVTGWTTTIIIVGLLSALLAALLAATGLDLKRVLAYSTVSQLGFMVTGIGIGAIFESQFYLVSHAIFKALLFLCAGAIIHEIGTRDMRQMGGLWRRMPQIAIPFLIGAAALVGLPFFNGFWSKELLMEMAWTYNPWVFVALVTVAAITAFYGARMCALVFFKPASIGGEEITGRLKVPGAMLVGIIPLAVGALTSWVLADRFAGWFESTMPYHANLIHHGHSSQSIISLGTVFSITTAITLAMTGLGIGAWWFYSRRMADGDMKNKPVPAILRLESVFDRSANGIASATQGMAAVLQKTQTGQLNWNIVGIIVATITLLAIISMIR